MRSLDSSIMKRGYHVRCSIYRKKSNLSTITTYSRFSWSSILAAVAVAVVLGILFHLLGIGLGLNLWKINPGGTSHELATGAIVWLVMSSLISMVAGGWIAGRFANTGSKVDGALHGLVMWAFATLISLLLVVSTAGKLASGTAFLLSSAVSLTGQGLETIGKSPFVSSSQVKDLVQDSIPDVAKIVSQTVDEAQELLAELAVPSNSQDRLPLAGDMKKKLKSAITEMFSADKGDRSSAKQKLVNFLELKLNIPSDRATATVNGWEKNFEEVKAEIEKQSEQTWQKAQEIAAQVAKAISSMALIFFFLLLAGAISAFIGGRWGVLSVKRAESY